MIWLDTLLFYLLCLLVISFLAYTIAGKLHLGKLHEKYVFITGCDEGVGRMLATRLDKLGLHVFAACLLDSSIKELTDQCSSRLTAMKVDVAKPNDVKQAARLVKKVLGDKALWGLVNNAESANPAFTFEWHTREDYQRVVGTNLLGVVDTTLNLFPFIRKGREGRIVNVSSFSGRFSSDASPYNVSKFAVEGFSDGLSKEARVFNVTVHTIVPGVLKSSYAASFEERNRERWKILPKDVKEAYGEEYVNKSIEHHARCTSDPNESTDSVADAMVHALTARYPRERYVVGEQARFIFSPLSILPCWMQIFMVELMQKRANIKLPRPACVDQ